MGSNNQFILNQSTIIELVTIVKKAGTRVLELYDNSDTVITYKDDYSPVTNADIEAHEILVNNLKIKFPKMPIISEEDIIQDGSSLVDTKRFFLIDPIDGTKDFITKTGQFAVCLAVIENNHPVFGVVYAPALGSLYYGGKTFGSYKIQPNNGTIKLSTKGKSLSTILVGSSINSKTKGYITKNYSDVPTKRVGSQLKFALVAEGGSVYPRIDSTMKIWDVAAGQAIVEGAGGQVVRPSGDSVSYYPDHLLVGDFIARPF